MNAVAAIPTREQIDRFQELLSLYPQFEPETTHYFADGMYCRHVVQPEDSCVLGKEHAKPHFFVLLEGSMTVVGSGYRMKITAPRVLSCVPGDKRALYAHTRSVYMTIHKTDKTDLDEIEAELIRDDGKALFDSANKLKFDVPKFRELTVCVIANERPGFWSDWSKEEQLLYSEDRWEEFSRLLGYTDKQIEQFREWLGMIAQARKAGLNPYVYIHDLATGAALENLRDDSRGEILKSSRLAGEDSP